ncbi:MAG: ATP-dependent DNA helicase [Elusimicrobiota bacterium]
MPEEILKDLNPEQKLAVEHDLGPLLIIAGAGTGKTSVITRRIAYLIITKKARPEEILALTFTEKAAKEMEERVDLLVPYGYTDIWISTFHSFGDRVLRERNLEIGLSPEFQLLSRAEQIAFLREHLFEFPLEYYRPSGNPTKYIEALLTLFSRAKDEDISPEEYLNFIDNWEKTGPNGEGERSNEEQSAFREEIIKQRETGASYKKYQELLSATGKMDFGDQVYLALRMFRERSSILHYYQKKFKYILVDEFQDTNYAQYQLVKHLAAKHKNLTVVGDDDQSIYKFRGAAISNILNFIKDYPQAREVVLNKNYRSTQKILDRAYRLINYNNPERLEIKNKVNKELVAVNKTKSIDVKYLFYEHVLNEADDIAARIAAAVEKGGRHYNDFALLVRSNHAAEHFLKALTYKNIPWRFTGNAGLYSRPEIMLLVNFLRSVANSFDSLSLYHLLTTEIYAFPMDDLCKCNHWARLQNQPLERIFSDPKNYAELELSEKTLTIIPLLLSDLQRYREASRDKTPAQLIYHFLDDSGYLKKLTKLTKKDDLGAVEKIQNIAKFFEIIRQFEGQTHLDRLPGFINYLDTLIDAGDNPAVAEADFEEDAVHLLTVHKAKGLEFPVVFMVGLAHGQFPSRNRVDQLELPEGLIKDILPEGNFHLQEERRLFYVGMTRAKEELYLSWSQNYGGKSLRKVSQFVKEALDLPVEPALIKKPINLENLAGQVTGAPIQLQLKIGQTKNIQLNAHQIDDYLTCPLKYMFVHVLRVPVLSHPAVIYGRAIHRAVEEYSRQKTQGKKLELPQLIKVFEESWKSIGFLSREHEERRLEDGRKALALYYQREEASGKTPTHIEKDFKFKLGDFKVVGRWDRVDVEENKVTIIDFKSSDVRKQEEADKRIKSNDQMAVYALAWMELDHSLPCRIELHFLESGLVGGMDIDGKHLEKIKEKILTVAGGISQQNFQANPDYFACRYCAYQAICPEKE